MLGWIVLIVGSLLTLWAALLAFVPQRFENPRRHQSEQFRPGNRLRIAFVVAAVILGFGTAVLHTTVQKNAICKDALAIFHEQSYRAEDAATAAGYVLVSIDGESDKDSEGITR